MKSLSLILLFLSSSLSLAQDPFCQRTQKDIIQLIDHPLQRIAFKNRGGLFKGGVCWWHSRLQRSSYYLARYAPSAPKPNVSEVRSILGHLRRMDSVVVIPGYDNFESFTREHEAQVQKVLEEWQKIDGFLNMKWIKGISGNYRLSAKKLEARMKLVYETYKSSPTPIWVLAQMKGIIAHSFLVRRMEVLPSGYLMEVIDSNKPGEMRTIRYQFGDTSLKIQRTKREFVLYTGFQQDFVKMKRSLQRHCKSIMSEDFIPLDDLMSGEIEIGP